MASTTHKCKYTKKILYSENLVNHFAELLDGAPHWHTIMMGGDMIYGLSKALDFRVCHK